MAHNCTKIPADGPWYDYAGVLVTVLDDQKAMNAGNPGWATHYTEFEPYAALVLLHDHLSEALGEDALAPAMWEGGFFMPGNVHFLADAVTNGLIEDRNSPNDAPPPPTWHTPGPNWLGTAPPGKNPNKTAIQRAKDLLQRVRGALDIPG